MDAELRCFMVGHTKNTSSLNIVWPGKLVTTVVIYYSYTSCIGNTDFDTDIQCFELVILRQGDFTETRPSHATLNLLNRRHPVSRRLRATDHWVNQQPRVHKPSVSTEACKLFNIFHKLAPGEDRTRVSPKSDACPYHPDRGGKSKQTPLKQPKLSNRELELLQTPLKQPKLSNRELEL
ncbi:hypothetical protein LXL04_035663 [Taraxacum kok-saghyz]